MVVSFPLAPGGRGSYKARPHPSPLPPGARELSLPSKIAASYAATSWRLRAGLRPGPATSSLGRGLFERSEFRSPHHRDRGAGTRRATPGRHWFWVLLPKQKDLVVWGRTPTSFLSTCGAETPHKKPKTLDARSGSGMTQTATAVFRRRTDGPLTPVYTPTGGEGACYDFAMFCYAVAMPCYDFAIILLCPAIFAMILL